MVIVKVKCVSCKATKDVGPGQEQPMCDVCYMPMLVVEVSSKKGR